MGKGERVGIVNGAIRQTKLSRQNDMPLNGLAEAMTRIKNKRFLKPISPGSKKCMKLVLESRLSNNSLKDYFRNGKRQTGILL